MEYNRFEKPSKPYVVIDKTQTKCKLFEKLEDAEEFALRLSKKEKKVFYVTKAELGIDGYRCIILSSFDCGYYSDITKDRVLVHYAFYMLCEELKG